MLGALCAVTACSSMNDTVMSAYSGDKYVPRPNIPVSQYTNENFREDRMDRRLYNEYEHREQCQRYRRIPRNSVEISSCNVVRAPKQAAAEVVTNRVVLMGPIISSYTIYFNFDKSNIRNSEEATLDQVVSEIAKYNPSKVTVTGFADRSGKASYNETLSAKRAKSVSDALTRRGVVNEIIREDARGEYDNAVPTPDGVKLQENRRVVIDFRK